MGSPITGIAFVNAVLFWAIGQSKLFILYYRNKSELSIADIATAGAIAGASKTISSFESSDKIV